MMQLLDAILAFALTMAALATVVTVIMEAGLRMARMRKKNFIEVMKLLNQELGKGTLGMTDEERWDFFVRVVNNPAEASIDLVKKNWKDLPLDQRLSYFGRDKAAGRPWVARLGLFVWGVVRDKKRSGLYEEVSLEYMLRCLADTPSVKQASKAASDSLKIEFNRIARKYEEFGSSVSASFRRQAQTWSIAIGIALAIVANINGLRIFETYRLNPDLAVAVIEKQSEFLADQQAAAKRTEEITAIEARLKQAQDALAGAEAAGTDPGVIGKLKQQVAAAEADLEAQASIEKIQQAAIQARQQIADLTAMGVPIGWEFYPQCPFGEGKEKWAASSPECRAIKAEFRVRKSPRLLQRIYSTLICDSSGFIIWFFIVVVTGILIGLGAPFWFDVAKRVSQIRKGMQKSSASAEYRLSAKDANGDPEERKKIVDGVLAQAAGEAELASKSTPKGRVLLSSDGTVSPEGG